MLNKALLTVSVTCTATEVVPALNVTDPVNVPGAKDAAAEFTDIPTVACVVPLGADTVIQFTFDLTVNVTGSPELATVTFCRAGADPPATCENDKEAGVTVKAGAY